MAALPKTIWKIFPFGKGHSLNAHGRALARLFARPGAEKKQEEEVKNSTTTVITYSSCVLSRIPAHAHTQKGKKNTG